MGAQTSASETGPTTGMSLASSTLLFSHGTWLILSVTPTFFTHSFFPLLSNPSLRPFLFPLGLMWQIVATIASLIVLYFIAKSWGASRKLRHIFGDFAFALVLIVGLLFLMGNIWTLVVIAQL